MFLNTQSGSVLLAACSRRELSAGLPFAHRLWDVMLADGMSPCFQGSPNPHERCFSLNFAYASCARVVHSLVTTFYSAFFWSIVLLAHVSLC